ncbi:extracellular solute-binding protein [Verminephrobacter eiseniae]|uniref:extracellular solute-binding protein n=1 Tax=Verminephrobacter eiseniae TaxID=364317 RepID=UPI002237B825|nr:extracellular solute-binding protein [Verminephrobacter eiseniae]MCW5260271.1 extracellular solute-binding protein [Verminephrobacter eiseniae]
MTPAKPNLTRRRFSQDLLAASSVAFPGWLHAQGKGKEIVVGGAGSHKIFLDPLIPVFEKQTGCKVLFEGTRSLVNLEKMLSNKSSPYMSVVLMDDPVMIAAVKEGVLDKLSAGAIPSLAKLKPGTVHMDGMWANYMQSTTGVAINTGKLRQLPSYATLWEPAFKNKLIIPSLQNTEGLAMIAAAAMLETGKPMKEAQYLPDAAFKKLKALKPNLLTVYTQVPQALNLLEQGEASAIAAMIGFNAFDRKAKGAPIDFLLPKEGGMAMPTGVAKVKGAPEQALADAFIECMLGAWQQRICDISLAWPTNTSVAAPAGVPKGTVFVPDWAYISERRKGWVERWDREMAI